MSLTLLLVDDDRVDRMAVRRALASIDPVLVEVDDLEGARRELATRAFDAVLLDLRLPGGDGVELLRELRARGDDLPVIVLTGHGDEQTAVDLLKSGATDYHSKLSLSPQRLAQSIRAAVHVRAVEREARRAARELTEAQERYRFLAESIPQMVWVAAADGVVTYANGRCREYLGLDPAAPVAEAWPRSLHPDDRARFERCWSEAVARGGRFECEARLLRHADRTYRWHLSRAESMRSRDGLVKEWFGTSTDIEDQKQSEAQHARLAEEAQAASRAKDVFLATLSHELRTPMNAILGWISMMRTQNMSPERIQRAIEVIDRNARIQTQLIEDLLDVSRIVSGKLRIERRPVDVGAVVHAAVEATRPAAEAKRVALSLSVGEGLAVIGDAARLQQVVWNLLANAVKFTPADGRVEVRAARAGDELRLEVIDSGEGIAPDFLPFVFERFLQGQGHASRRHGGLGLGLSIVRHFVEMHEGRIRAESDGPGRGARFVVTLPAFAAIPAPSARPDGPASARGPALAGVDVLVVDDDEDAREMMALALGSYGAAVRIAGSVEQARAAIQGARPAVVVSDIGMPNEDGYALIADLRQGRLGEAHIPAIALTGYAGLEDQRRAREAGFDAHVTKPVDFGRLVGCVARLAGGPRLATTPAR